MNKKPRLAVQPSPSTKPEGEGFWFDVFMADRAVRWIEHYCKHTVGTLAGQAFILSPWEERTVRQIFGWKRADGTRRYRIVYIEIARKNGKTTFCAAIAAFLTIRDGEPAAQVFSIAGNAEQARLVFDEATRMVLSNPELHKPTGDVEVFKTSLYVPETGSSFKPLTGKAATKHGLNPSGVIGDEVHVWTDREQYDVMQTAVGARKQPLQIYITTAGYDRNSICWELHDTAIKVRDGVLDLPSFLPVIFAADLEDDWTTPETWRKANPNMGISVSEEYLAEQCKAAQAVPAQENVFKRLHLNIWTDAASRWLRTEDWDAGDRVKFTPAVLKKLEGATCYSGLDLARVSDLSALTHWFPPGNPVSDDCWVKLSRFWCPAEDITKRSKALRAPYDVWEREGFIESTPGNITDFAFIEQAILDDFAKYNIMGLGIDRTFAGELVNNLMAENVPLIQVGQGFLSMAAPTAELERIVVGHKVLHGGNPISRWCISNTVVRTDPAGNLKPDKERSLEKIDDVAASCNALAVYLAGEQSRSAPCPWDDPEFKLAVA